MRKILLCVALAAGLAGCSTLQNAYDVVTSASVSPTMVIVAGNSADALEATATNYLKLKRCTGSNGPICRSPTATAQLIPAVRAVRVARTNLESFLAANPGALGPTGLYNALTAATATLQSVISQYNIGASK